MLYWLTKNLTYILVRIIFRMRYEGLEHIPKGGRYVLCSNHRTVFDPVFMCHKIPLPIRSMAKQELFSSPFFGAFIRRLGAFPIARGTGDTSTIDTAVEILESGGVLLIFPEGTRSKDNRPLRARSGVSLISGRAGAGVLPCSIDYTGKLKFRTRITMRYHPLLTAEELNINIDSSSSMRSGAKMVMKRITEGLTPMPEDD